MKSRPTRNTSSTCAGWWGHPTPNAYDPTGTRFGFEMGAAKTSGGQDWADVAKIGSFGWEYKGKEADLEKAYDQLLRYRDALQNPPLLIVSDINHIIIRTNYTNLPTRTYSLALDDLLKPESIEILRTVFYNPEQLKPKETTESVTREAAARFSRLADNLRRYGSEPRRSPTSSSACCSACSPRISGSCLKIFSRACSSRPAATRRISPTCSASCSGP